LSLPISRWRPTNAPPVNVAIANPSSLHSEVD
jgi:hypothetical protein